MNTKPVFKTKEGMDEVLAVYDTVLSGWPVPHKILNIETRYGNTHIIACGDDRKPALILLHGSAFNSLMWLADMEKYAQNHMVYAVDIPGEPGKSGNVQYPLSGPTYSEWLDDVIEKLGCNKVSIAGISLGGWMALNYSVNHPEKVEKLVLICPAGIGPQRISFLIRSIPSMLSGEKGYDKVSRLINGDQPIPEEVAAYSKMISRNFNLRMAIPLFSDEQLKKLTMRIAVFVGEKDVLLDSKKTAARVGRLLPQAWISVIPGAPHTLINQTNQIISFLEAK